MSDWQQVIEENARLKAELAEARAHTPQQSNLNQQARRQFQSILNKLPRWFWLMPPLRWSSLARQRRSVLKSKLLDPVYYLLYNEDVRKANMDPVLHYLIFGGHEGRRPNPYFDSAWYLQTYKDVARSGINPLVHYISLGAQEGRAAGPLFDTQFYVASHPDVAASRMNPLLHFIRHGKKDGRAGVRTKPLAPRPKAPDDAVWQRLAVSRSTVRPKSPLVDVIIPVYEGYDDTLACIFSVLKATPVTRHELVVIDDCSPDKTLSRKLRELSGLGLFTLLVNKSNRGFVVSVNRGMALHLDRDVLLLNSDTVVYNDWLDRIRAQAGVEGVGTVTPLSTNATICSYPVSNKDNPELLELGYDELDRLCADTNRGQSVEIPTAVGFCMYIRRACLDAVGLFDAEAFGKGYGEENDFCRRAVKAGWRNIMAADVFVRHTGEVSFGQSVPAGQKHALKILLEKHPDYNNKVRDFNKRNPAAAIRRRLDAARLARMTKGRAILHVTHNWGGGIERHITDLAEMFVRQEVATVLMTAPERDKSHVKLDTLPATYMPNLADIDLEPNLSELAEILKLAGVQRIHIHSLAGWPVEATGLIRKLAAMAGVPYEFTFHDYLAFCPRINMIDASGRYCGEKGISTCKRCIMANGSPFGRVDMVEWREHYGQLLKGASRLIAPSDDTARRAGNYLRDAKIHVRPHPEKAIKGETIALRWKQGERLRIVIIGAIGPHKGSEVLLAMAQDAQARDLPIDYIIIGHTDRDSKFLKLRNMTLTGRYEEASLHRLMKEHAGHIAFLPSVCPETYSYVLSTVLAAAYPVAAFDLGAIGGRLKERDEKMSLLLPIALAARPSQINDRLLAKAREGIRPSRKAGWPERTYALESYYDQSIPQRRKKRK